MLTGSGGYLWGLILLIMIKVNELRVGNLIYAGTDENDQPQAGKVLQIFEDVIHWTFDLNQKSINEGYNSTDLRYVNPILLTPEWMERCGFEKDDERYDGETLIMRRGVIELRHDEDQPLTGYSIAIYDDGTLAFVRYSILYLHQLQNLYFALTGEEIQIKMP
jgi:hypothetical protein